MRYVYLKQNNAVQELKRVSQLAGALPEGGPDAYVAHFLHIVGNNPTLLLSLKSDFPCGEEISIDNIEAKTFYWYSKLFRKFEKIASKPLFTFLPRLIVGIKIFIQLFRFKPNVILCWANLFPLWATYLIVILCKSRFVYCRHTRIDLNNKSIIKRIFQIIDTSIMRKASKVIVHGPYLKQQAIDYGVEHDRLIEFNWSFRDMPEIINIDSKDVNNKNKKIILFIGRLEANKGIFDLLDACVDRLKSDTNIKLVYAGDGGGHKKLLQQVEERGLVNNVMLHGKVPHQNLAELISESTVVVTPTREEFPEGRCMATMEGLVMGKPVIAPNFGPFPYLVKHDQNGLLYKPDSIKDMQDKIFQLLDDSALYRKLCSGAEYSSKELRIQGPNFSEALKIAFNEE